MRAVALPEGLRSTWYDRWEKSPGPPTRGGPVGGAVVGGEREAVALGAGLTLRGLRADVELRLRLGAGAVVGRRVRGQLLLLHGMSPLSH